MQGGYQVGAVDGDNKVSIRTVNVGDRVGNQWIIADGPAGRTGMLVRRLVVHPQTSVLGQLGH